MNTDDLPTTKQLKKLLRLRLRYEALEYEILNPGRALRRRIFYMYPNGAAPLLGLLDLLEK
jgi:hypothetical protein